MDLETAVAHILAALPPPQSERVKLTEAVDRLLTESIGSPIDLPVFDNSAMDGYAVRATDVAAAASSTPVTLRVRARIPAGEMFAGEIEPGECARLFTGSPMPAGADAVVMQEDTLLEPGRPGEVLICGPVHSGENVRRRGEDVARGAALLEAGAPLTPAGIGLLGAVGITNVTVGLRPIVGLVATGSELREPGSPLQPGQIYESNRAMLAPLVARAGGVPQNFPLVLDSLGDTQAALQQAFAKCDLVVTSGGVSVGETDFVKAAFEALGGELQFWRVAMRPGRPFAFGRLGGKFLLGLPGNPVSAFVTFLLLVHPAIRCWQGAKQVGLAVHPGVLGEAISNAGDRRHFLRVRVDNEGKVVSAGQQASHVLASLAASDGLLDVPPQTTLPAGTVVRVQRYQ